MSSYLRQIWTLMAKNFRTLLFRHLLLVVCMAVLVPILLASFFTFAKNLFVPPAKFGIGTAHDVRSLPEAFDTAIDSGRTKVVLISNGHDGGHIETVLDFIARQTTEYGSPMSVVRLKDERELSSECRSSLRGVTNCYCALVMRSSPNEGRGGIWNYTIRTDAAMWESPVKINVDSANNMEEVYLLPMQRAVDTVIARLNGSNTSPLAQTREMPFTSQTQKERDRIVRQHFHKAIVNFMGVAFISNIIWITYHVTGLIATERESGISQLIDAMMPVARPWMAPFARLTSHHLSFSLIYAPAWIIGSIIIRSGVFVNTSVGIVLIVNILAGLAFTSFSIFIATFFRKAQLSSITAILATLLLGILAQSLTQPKTGPVVALSVLFPPCNYVYFITLMARFEKQDRATNLLEEPPNSPWSMPGIVFWILMVLQIFVYLFLAIYNEKRFYGTSVRGRHVQMSRDEVDSLGENAIELDSLTKVYRPSVLSKLRSKLRKNGAEPVVAVNGLSFTAGRGQIVALLGANGSGKSTTLDAIAGLHRLTSGSIKIDGTGGLGIAPQKNVLWDDLNVEEHLNIFNRLKAPQNRASKDEISELIRSIDLSQKRRSLAKTLSGGQKRKLQLGMMLTGGSAVCCVDEVSSGLDPLSRRKIWDILLAERGKRTLILTTHFLDEADLLADHIAILSKGTLRAEGSSVELKDRFGGGYRIHVNKAAAGAATPDIDGVVKKDVFDSITYVAPNSSLAAEVIRGLETAGISDYRFSGPTIEDVFLQLAEEIKDEKAFQTIDSTDPKVEVMEKGQEHDSSSQSSADRGLKLVDGKRVSYASQVGILFRKRITVFKKNQLLYFIAFILPIIAASLTSLFVRGKEPTGCSASEQSSSWGTEDAFSQIKDDRSVAFLAGPPSRLNPSTASSLFSPIFSGSGGASQSVGGAALNNLHLVNTYNEFTEYIVNHRANITTGLWLGDDSSPPTIGWVANLFVTSSLTAQQFLDILLANTSIATTWSPFDIPFNPGIGDALNLVIYMGIAFVCYPAFFGLYPSTERRRFVRALQYSNGVRPFPLWAAYLIFDFFIVLTTSAIVTGLWYGLSDIWYHLEYIFIVFFLYGLAATLLAYFVSLFTKTQLATFAWAAAYQGVIFLAYLISYVCVITYVKVDKIDSSLLICHFVVSAFAPIGSAMRALFISTNLFATACDGQVISQKPTSFVMYGGPITYLVIQCFALFGLVLWFDSGSVGSTLRSLLERRRRRHAGAGEDDLDDEMANELTRVTSSGTHEDGLRVMHLTKSFGKNTAVDNVTFGVKRGEVFALLGPNGAGKSTTISLIRGDLKPSHNGGDVFVEEESVSGNLAAARTHLGVCPQIDALDQMTVREHLEFYARVRGVADIQHNVAAVLRAVGLEAFESRMGHALSGGNKRKLSLGIALMGNPTVVLLDEPSSGLDAASKRIMWKTLAATVHGRSILLTTHSMEEADALAGRAGILARRMLALGTPDDLRHRFGDALHVHLVSASAPRTTEAEVDRITTWIRETLPSAALDAKTYHGQMRFSVSAKDVVAAFASSQRPTYSGGESDTGTDDEIHPAEDCKANQGSAIGQLVVLLEEHKARLGVQHYSVSPTTLDQVFLTIVGRHNVREENYDEKKRGLWSKFWNFGRS
ncbi:ABC transporter [Purpureocillium lavendulum]|uniref:ABC transporter n=1 Tax=Purpureocillium lavendulum TaxID=1247861 RepID=A0AB34FJR0_9HYPO|nr:ABC transporter [Purpureocillium lavendulum]